jgi:hypothetical protein
VKSLRHKQRTGFNLCFNSPSNLSPKYFWLRLISTCAGFVYHLNIQSRNVSQARSRRRYRILDSFFNSEDVPLGPYQHYIALQHRPQHSDVFRCLAETFAICRVECPSFLSLECALKIWQNSLNISLKSVESFLSCHVRIQEKTLAASLQLSLRAH